MTDLNPVTNPDAQEALSRVQGNATVMLLPLSSGRVAVLGRDFQLHDILDQAPDTEGLITLSTELALKLGKKVQLFREEWAEMMEAATNIKAHVTVTNHPPKQKLVLEF